MSGLQGGAELKAGFSLDTKPRILVVATNNNKVFINLGKVERIRVAEERL